MEICIMGNSHTGALKQAWDAVIDDFPNIQITFFAQGQDTLNYLIVQNNKLIPEREGFAKALEFISGGKREIDPTEYDIFLLYGLNARANFFIPNTFSTAVVNTAMKDLTNGSLSYTLLQRLRKITDKKVFIGHNQLTATDNVISTDYPESYIKGIEKINEFIYRPLNAELICQPLETIVNGNRTKGEFSRGSKKIIVRSSDIDNTAHVETDNCHMNAQFGELWLSNFLKQYLNQ